MQTAAMRRVLSVWVPVQARVTSGRLLLGSAGRGSDLAGAHEVADILLQEFVVAVELVVFLADGLYAVENINEGLLKRLGVPALMMG